MELCRISAESNTSRSWRNCVAERTAEPLVVRPLAALVQSHDHIAPRWAPDPRHLSPPGRDVSRSATAGRPAGAKWGRLRRPSVAATRRHSIAHGRSPVKTETPPVVSPNGGETRRLHRPTHRRRQCPSQAVRDAKPPCIRTASVAVRAELGKRNGQGRPARVGVSDRRTRGCGRTPASVTSTEALDKPIESTREIVP
jgi:hypothetical protein